MPTYEYRCGSCGEKFERFERITADPLTDCPHCGTEDAVKRLISAGSGFIFKGSGFYITDNRSSSYQEAAKKDTESTGTDSKDTKSKSSSSKDTESTSSSSKDSSSDSSSDTSSAKSD